MTQYYEDGKGPYINLMVYGNGSAGGVYAGTNYTGSNAAVTGTATFTFGDSEWNDHDEQTISLTDAAGKTKTYKIMRDNDAVATSSGQYINEFNAGANASAAATNFKTVVEHAHGHGGSITIVANSSAGRVNMTQATAGTSGNTVIAVSSQWNALCDTNVGSAFTGGIDITGKDLLIWSIKAHNTETYDFVSDTTKIAGSDIGFIKLYDNAAAARTAAEDDDFLIFAQHLSPTKVSLAEDEGGHDAPNDVKGPLSEVCWNFKHPILVRNGLYVAPDTSTDFTILCTVLDSSSPYDNVNSPSSGDKLKYSKLIPKTISCKGKWLEDLGDPLAAQDITTVDTEIWGMCYWNGENSEQWLRFKDGSNTLLGQYQVAGYRIAGSSVGDDALLNRGSYRAPVFFERPMYAKGGLKIETTDTVGTLDDCLYVTLIVRELESDGQALDTSGRR